jgi:hypothetical protein
MPSYYLPREKKGLSLNMILALVVGIVLLIALVVVVLLLMNRETPTVPIQQPIVEQPITNTPVTPTPNPQIQPEPIPVEIVPVVVLPEPKTIPMPVDTDTDQDGLTDVEEQLFLTSAAVPDTDGDSFLDGNEVKSLYDPATPGALLEVSPQVKLARNESFGYQLMVPVLWTASKTKADGTQFVIRPSTGTESFTLEVFTNENRESILQWYQSQTNRTDVTSFINFSNEAGWEGIQTTDHTLVIATLDDGGPGSRAFVFVMYYDAGQETVLRYRSVWDMMTNSLAPLISPIPTNL